ncbi:MAG: DUF983 domain-containing protein [Planctomycetia bacterium]
MEPPRSRGTSLSRALALRCPRCGGGRLFAGWFRMHPACDRCGLPFTREPGFYLGSIYVNYGITVLLTGAIYAAILGLGGSHEAALTTCLAVAVLFPVIFFRHARSLLLALDSSVNRHQGGDPAALASDDASAGCLMGAALVAILIFGLGLAVVTVAFSRTGTPAGDPGSADEVDLR